MSRLAHKGLHEPLRSPGPESLLEDSDSNMREPFHRTAFSRRRLHRHSLIMASLAAITAFGCGESTVQLPSVTTYPVHGKIVLADGRTTLTEGTITFVPVDPETGRQAVGAIAADGTFALHTTPTQEGAAAGEYRVSVSSVASASTDRVGFGVPLVDPRFGDDASSGLTATVKAETNELPPIVLDPSKAPIPAGVILQIDPRDRG